MSNNFDITINDFENICRTCLSREDLKPLYEKCLRSTCLAEMLMSCTVVKFTEDDGLPVKICTNCINEINQAFSFAKRCETTDTILRKCVKIKTEFEITSSQSQNVEPIIKPEEEMQIEITPDIMLPNTHPTVEVLGNYEFVEVKQEKDEKTEYDDPANESYEDVDEDQDKNYSEKSRPWRGSTNSEIEDESSKDEDGPCPAKKGNKNGTYQCETCEESFEKLDLLTVHQWIHMDKKDDTQEKPYSCEVCSKAFNRQQRLNQHMSIHTGEKQHKCGICNKGFTRAETLKEHMRIHTGERPYTCEVCSKTFQQLYSLNHHMRTHTGERPYTCEVCSKAFIQRNHLKEHMSIHTGEKLYSCELCNRAFSQSSKLKRHMRTHTGEKPYICGVCSKTFTQPCNLNRHMRTCPPERSVPPVASVSSNDTKVP